MQKSATAHPNRRSHCDAADPLLAEAYLLCEAITRQCSKSFYVATMLLPPTKRRAIRVLYAFCRRSDDLVDEASSDPTNHFACWVTQAAKQRIHHSDPILYAWQHLRHQYQLSEEVIADLLAGIQMDLTIDRYATFADLWLYCYRVAGTVGLLSMQIIGSAPGAEPYAIKLGVALQLTNILRDIGEDAQRGRIYLPQDELATYAITDQDILTNCNDERWQQLMRFYIQRTRTLYAEALPGISLLTRDSRYAVAAAAMLYRAILTKIEKNQYDNFHQRAFVPNHEKLSMLPKIWWQTYQLSRYTPTHQPEVH